jgi:hypothetical protein
MNPAQARSIRMTPGPDGTFGWGGEFLNEFTILTSTTVVSGRVIVIDAADFASATGGGPDFDVSETATLHMEDTTPLQIGATGAPNTVAAPTQSMFQTAQIALRLLIDTSWAMRRTGMVQYVDAVTW